MCAPFAFVFVSFRSHRCPPCKAIKPLYEELSEKYSDVAFGKVDVDDNSDAAMEFNISAVPTFVFFDGEEQIERFSGADPNQLESLIKSLDSR
jgi:thioredoxin 1